MARVNIGDRFDKLEVIERANDILSESGLTKYKAWKCKCDCGEEVSVKQNYLTKEHPYKHSCGKCPQEENDNYTPPNMTPEEKRNWDALYEYVRSNIMGYEKGMALSSYIVTRLKGLTTGNFRVNKHIKKNADYSFETVLNTFKFCSPEILRALRSGGFKDEQHKINYIFKIVESNINNVYMREKNIVKAKEEAKTMTVDSMSYTGAEYQRKTEETTNKLLDELW